MRSITGYSIQTIRRLPGYYNLAKKVDSDEVSHISSTVMAKHLNLDPIMVRKDLEQIGVVGKPKVGFEVTALMETIAEFMGWNRHDRMVLVGCGGLGSALLGYSGFAEHGFEIVAGFDTDPGKIGTEIHDKHILDLEDLPNLCQRMHIDVGIITVPAMYAQDVAERMVASGIQGIWNFSPTPLDVPPHIQIQQEDIVSSLAILLKKLQKTTD